MSLPTVADVVKIQLQWTVYGDPLATTTLYWGYSGGPPSSADCATLAAAIAAAATSGFESLAHVNIALDAVQVTDLSSMSGGVNGAVATFTGSRSGGQLAPGSAVVANYGIARRYRGGKPRSYFPFGTSTDLSTAGLFDIGFVGDVLAGLTTFVGAVNGASAGSTTLTSQRNIGYYSGYTLGPASAGGYRKKIPTPLGVPHNDAILSRAASIFVGSQRRRNRDA
jgi:hypothetical protein